MGTETRGSEDSKAGPKEGSKENSENTGGNSNGVSKKGQLAAQQRIHNAH